MEEGLVRAAAQGHRIVVLVGDEPYYRRFGFSRALTRSLKLPGWVDKERFLARELVTGAMASASGMIGKPHNALADRSEEHTSELQSLMRISYAVFCLKK